MSNIITAIQSLRNNEPYDLRVAKGLIKKARSFSIFGRNTNIDTGDIPVNLWNGGGLYTGYLYAGEQLRVKAGGHADDEFAGINAWSILLEGLDDAGLEITETLELNGTSASSLTTLYFKRLNQVTVTAVGTEHAFNAGEIIIETGTGTIMMAMPAGTNRSHAAHYTVPSNGTLFLRSFTITTSGANSTNTAFDVFVDRGDTGVLESVRPIDVVEGGGYTTFAPWFMLPANSIVEVRCISTTSNNVSASVFIDSLLILD